MKPSERRVAYCMVGLVLIWQTSIRAEELVIEGASVEEREYLSTVEQEAGLRELRSLNGGNVLVISAPETQRNELLDRLRTALPSLVITAIGDYTSLFSQARTIGGLSQSQSDLVTAMQRNGGKVAVFELSPNSIVLHALSEGFGPEDGLREPGSFKIPLTEEVTAIVSVDSPTASGDPQAWTGGVLELREHGEVRQLWGRATLIYGANGISGSVQVETRIFSIRPIGGGLHAVLETDTRGLPAARPPRTGNDTRDQSPLDGQTTGAQTDEPDQNTTNDGTKIDLFVAYTPAVASQYLDVKSDLLDVAVAETNWSLYSSGITDVTFDLASSAQVQYVESLTWKDHLDHLVNGCDGVMDEVHQLREQNHADIVLLIVAVGGACGEAYATFATAETAFAVVRVDCATGYYSFGHEIAHLIGARHERSVDAANTPFQYGHGFSHHLEWRTIMARGDNCAHCMRLPYWSGPDVEIGGIAAGTAKYADNVRVIKSESPNVAAFR